jgi:hypothetical protein
LAQNEVRITARKSCLIQGVQIVSCGQTLTNEIINLAGSEMGRIHSANDDGSILAGLGWVIALKGDAQQLVG